MYRVNQINKQIAYHRDQVRYFQDKIEALDIADVRKDYLWNKPWWNHQESVGKDFWSGREVSPYKGGWKKTESWKGDRYQKYKIYRWLEAVRFHRGRITVLKRQLFKVRITMNKYRRFR